MGNVVHELQYDGVETAYRYNADGLLIEALNQEGKIALTRDKQGRIVQEMQGDHTIDRKYNKQGECIHIGSSLGADIRQEFDEEGNLIQIQSGNDWQADWKRDNTGLEIHRQLTGGVSVRTDRDRFGREVRKSIGVKNVETSNKQYLWGIGNRLQSIYNERTGTHANFEYDVFDNLIKADYNDLSGQTESIYRAPDAIGNLYKDKDRKDRRYGKGGRLLEDPNYYYHYDCEGNLVFKEFKRMMGYSSLGKEAIEKKYGIKFKATATGWLYEWDASGMLRKVVNPQQGKIRFGYDPLGRRAYKEVKNKRTCWLWDGNVPLHEWTEEKQEPEINLITWVFEDDGFVPCACIKDGESYSIITDYLGTPTQMYNRKGEETWSVDLDIYGRVRTFTGSSLSDCPFRYQGQYEDVETGLYYNRFRYYDASIGNYISQDPIGLNGGILNLYGYVNDPNRWIDAFGLAAANGGNAPKHGGTGHNSIIDQEIASLQADPTVTNIRKNQQQVDIGGNNVGTNRPDIQYDQNGVHHNIEYDTTVKGSNKHQNQIPVNDPNSRNTFWQIDDQGNVITGHSQLPQSQQGVSTSNTADDQQSTKVKMGQH